jgi:mono/diheme cytochrome c family protein
MPATGPEGCAMHLLSAARVLVLSAFLATGSGKAVGGAGAAMPPDGEALAGELGCAGCHAGVGSADLIRGRAPALGPDAPPLPAGFVFAFLEDPQRRRQDIGASRMPDFQLDEGERLALALYLGSRVPGTQVPGTQDGAAAVAEARRAHPDVTAETGRRIFDVLGCAGCHAGVAGATRMSAPDLAREGARARPDWVRAFLAAPEPVRGDGHPDLRGARMPDFRLTPDETAALASWLSGLGRPFADLDGAPLTPFAERRTERLIQDRLACMGCHRIGERGGDIGPVLDGVAGRRIPSYVLEMILDPQRGAPGAPMPHQPLEPREAARVARYLLALPAAEAPPTRTSLTDPAHPAWAGSFDAGGEGAAGRGGEGAAGRGGQGAPEGAGEGAALYARHCAACHGTQGEGDGWNAWTLPVPPAVHADAERMGKRADDTLYDGIHAGAWVLDGSPRMPAFGDLLTPRQIRSLVRYIRTLCACSGPAWSRGGATGAGPATRTPEGGP